MYHLCLGFFLNALIFLLIGMGPALFLLRSEQQFVTALVVAPVIGVALTTVAGLWFVIDDVPVANWAWPWALLASGGSVALALPNFSRSSNGLDRADCRVGCAAIIVLGVTAVVLVAPQLAGGMQYSILRGNGADTMNYVAGAGFLDREHYSALKLDSQALSDLHQSYLRVRNLVTGGRWTTFMLLAFCSRVAGLAIYRFEYCFTLLFFLFASGPSFLIARRLTLGLFASALTAMAVSTGFWAQYVLDIRAMSHINSIPLLLGIILLIVRIENHRSVGTAWGECALLGLAGAALVSLYAEICPMTALGVATFFIFCRPRWFSIRYVRGYMLSAGLGIIMILPALSFLWRYIGIQVATAAHNKVPLLWIRSGLNWLYSDPILGVWGFSPFTKDGFAPPILGEALHSFVFIVGIILILSLIIMLGQFVWRRRKGDPLEMSLLICITLACLAQTVFLLECKQLWGAGKALSYGYPFAMLAVAGFGAALWHPPRGRYARFLTSVSRYCTLLWLAVQCGLGVYRFRLAQTGREFDNYVWNHGEYRQHDLDLERFSAAIKRGSHPKVWSYISNLTVSEYAAYALGWETRMVSLLPTIDSGLMGMLPQRLSRDPQFLLADRHHPGAGDFSPDAVVAENAELILLRFMQDGRNRPLVVGVSSPARMVGQGASSLLWLAGDPVTLTVVAPAAGRAFLHGKFRIGPSAARRDYVEVSISSSANAASQAVKVTKDTDILRFSVTRGVNEITLKAIASPANYGPGNEPREVLGISGLNLGLDPPSLSLNPGQGGRRAAPHGIARS